MLGAQRLAEHRVMRAASVNPGARADLQVRPRPPQCPRHRQLRQRRRRLNHIDSVYDHAEAVAQIHQRGVQRRPRARIEHQPRRVGLAADAQLMRLQARLTRRDARADLKHMRAKHRHIPGLEVIGVIFHERGAAIQPLRHHLQRAQQRGRLPVALGAESIASRHQTLRGQARQLRQAVQIFECCGESGEVAFLQELRQPELDPRRLAHRIMPIATGAQVRAHEVSRLVFRRQRVNLGIADLIYHRGQVAHTIAVHLVAELRLGRHLVAFSDRDIAHIVAEARHLHALRFRPCGRRPRPNADLRLRQLIAPMPHDRLAPQTQPAHHEAEFAVAVRRLIQIHEVHVNLGPGDVAIVLRVKVQKRLPQRGQTGDPVLRRRKCVHPGDHADAITVAVGSPAKRVNLLGCRQHRLKDDLQRDRRCRIQRRRDFPRMRADLLNRLRPVQMLTAGQEPNLIIAKRHLSLLTSAIM